MADTSDLALVVTHQFHNPDTNQLMTVGTSITNAAQVKKILDSHLASFVVKTAASNFKQPEPAPVQEKLPLSEPAPAVSPVATSAPTSASK